MTNEPLSPEQDAALREYLSSPSRADRFKVQSRRTEEVKIILLGQAGSGMLCLARRLVWGEFYDDCDSTEDYSYRKLITIQGSRVMVEFQVIMSSWMSAMSPHYVRDVDAVFILYSVSNRQSFETVKTLHQDICSLVEGKNPIEVAQTSTATQHRLKKPVWVIASKIDLPAESWQVTKQEGEELSGEIGARFMNLSAKTGEGLAQAQLEDIVSWVLLNKISDQAASVDAVPKRSRWSIHRVSDKMKKMFDISHK